MIEVKVIQPFRYSPDGITVVALEKGRAELHPEFFELAVAEGWIEPPKKEKAAAKNSKQADDQSDGESSPPSDPPAE